MNFSELMSFFIPKMCFAILCGGLVGLERELKNKPAGIKTNILICLGAALYTSVSVLVSSSLAAHGHYGDPGRVAAQIVSGIGFIGGGTVIQTKGTIIGITTAATIWVVAALGICIGLGYGSIALVCAIIVIFILVGASAFEDRVLGRSLAFSCEVTVEDFSKNVKSALNNALTQNDLVLNDFTISTQGKNTMINVFYSGHRSNHKKFILELWNTPGIKEVKQS